ncbi:hypothetical protein [Pseudobacteriovorax antillogorgiicola]|uniref:DUF4382 domain-containing protein n=1 Tax=Pseudobacteriovorax antillogorgiicola TaxID=1513793 RepID=A0A1Y6CKJ2_9BACT|nr:hypothetical protein [Pseudobacteriovorax antillogorgiicola]TCS45664.1 hypothetical protein EDD56_12758 [Pseudobacteriovorax antillogorgiicola]SMF73010.1 hypothetical protein SAMN06296036_12757 [Pseudobacteriovorax antillogorgiicola]
MKVYLRPVLYIMICLGCGVNTSNPGTNGGSKGTTMLLKLPQSQSGASLGLNIVGVTLKGSQQYNVSESVTAKSGQQVALFSRQTVPAGSYTAVELSLDSNTPLTFVDSSGSSQQVYVPPVEVFEAIDDDLDLENGFQLQDHGRIAVLLSQIKRDLSVIEESEQIFSLQYDFTTSLIPLSEAHPVIQDYYSEAGLADDALIFDASIDEIDFEEFDYDFDDCLEDDDDCDEIDAGSGILAIEILSEDIDRACLYQLETELETIESDSSCEGASAIATTDEDRFFEAIVEADSYLVSFWKGEEFFATGQVEVSDQDEAYYVLDSSGTLQRESGSEDEN